MSLGCEAFGHVKGQRGRAYWISELVGLDVLQSHGEMNEVQVDVAKAPGFVLCLGHGQRVLSTMVVVPQLGGDEDIFPFDQAFVDGPLDALASFVLVLIIICAIE